MRRYAKVEITSRTEFRHLVQDKDYWVYRGHSDVAWRLETTLERAVVSRGLRMQRFTEEETFERFYQRAHHYVTAPPPKSERLEWEALLRHHGGPSRLLDVTDSPFIAAYFALEGSTEDKPFAVIAIHALEIHDKSARRIGPTHERLDFRNTYGAAQEFLRNEAARCVVLAKPERIARSLTIDAKIPVR